MNTTPKARSYNRTTRRKWKPEPYYESQEWKEDRKAHMATVKHCECEDPECSKTPSHSDHVIRWKKGGCIRDRRNREGLSHGCHRAKTAKEMNGYMYDFLITPKGLIPIYPKQWIKEPGWLFGYIRKHGYKAIHQGQLYHDIVTGKKPDLINKMIK